jgi:hypothetical protein
LQRKYGDSVTYEEDKLAHLKTEFGFDVLEVARGHFAPDSYHNSIGFGVPAPLLEQAFHYRKFGPNYLNSSGTRTLHTR